LGTAPKSLLIADDDPLVQVTLKYCLEEAGHRTAVANDGREALAYLEQNQVDTIFLDVFMPDKDGLETLLEIKRRFPHVRVIVMTGGGKRGRYDFLSTASKFGADGVLRKPVSASDLMALVNPDTPRVKAG